MKRMISIFGVDGLIKAMPYQGIAGLKSGIHYPYETDSLAHRDKQFSAGLLNVIMHRHG
jgi:hypothetical protein